MGRLAEQGLLQANPQRGFSTLPLSVDDLMTSRLFTGHFTSHCSPGAATVTSRVSHPRCETAPSCTNTGRAISAMAPIATSPASTTSSPISQWLAKYLLPLTHSSATFSALPIPLSNTSAPTVLKNASRTPAALVPPRSAAFPRPPRKPPPRIGEAALVWVLKLR